MKKIAMLLVPMAVVAVYFLTAGQQSAEARPPYKAAWDKAYMTEGSAMFKALEGKSNCNICHEGKDKKDRNAYGMAVAKGIGAKNEKDAEVIAAGIKKAAAAKSADGGPTFGELIESGKLPVTP